MNADLVLTNGKIYTQDPARPTARALAIRGDRLLAVGDDLAMKALLAEGGEWLDLGGRAVTPGLVDAHVHYQWYALNLIRLELHEVPSKEEALRRVREAAVGMPAGNWLVGRGWTQDLWHDHAFPSAADLDEAAGHLPVFLTHKSGHAAWANSRALRIAGVAAGTPDPPGGQIARDEAGRPTGILFENAMELVAEHVPRPTIDEIAAAMRLAQQKCWQAGLTGVHDFDGPSSFAALQSLQQAGELGLRIVKNIPAAHLDEAVSLGLRSGFGNDWLRIGGIKIFADGALGPRTAYMIAPYENEPDNRGIAVTDKEEMQALVSRASANSLSLTIHAIGDRANHDVLDVYQAVRAEEAARGGRALRHRIEHVQLLHPDDISRLAQLNVIASMQPTHATSDMDMADRYWGGRSRYAYAWRTLMNQGTAIVFGSDSPIEAIEPLPGIYAAVTRTRRGADPATDSWNPGERLTVDEAVRAFTFMPAYTAGLETRLGSIEPGKLADLTICDRDIYQVSPAELALAQVAGTVIGGQFRYRTF